MVTDQQVRYLMKMIQQGKSLEVAARKAGMDEKTARKYRELGKLPSENKPKRWWKTRIDIFNEVWLDWGLLFKTVSMIHFPPCKSLNENERGEKCICGK